MKVEKINVNLYGGKSIFKGVKETPLEAEITYCDKCYKCSFYKKGTCFNAGRWKANCRYGEKQIVKGYTSRANKYYEFKFNYTKDEVYAKLKEPNSTIGIVDDVVILNLLYVKINEDMQVEENVSFGKDELVYIPLNIFNNNIIKQLCDLRPRTLFGDGTIRKYYEEIIPRFLYELKIEFKDIYDNFINEYPEYDVKPNFIGRKAYIYTLKDNIEIKHRKGNFIKQNEYLIGNYKDSFLPFNTQEAEIKIKINDKMTCEITDNNQVDENTEFAD